MHSAEGLNTAAHATFLQTSEHSERLRIEPIELPCGAYLLDCGVAVQGGISAGLELASICMAGKAQIRTTTGDPNVWRGPWIQVATDHPVSSCIFAQYAGWPVQHDKYFAMGSGPMRVKRGKEELLGELNAFDSSRFAVGTLETDDLPDCSVAETIAQECGLSTDQLYLAVAPTSSIAGCVQVVARSVETCLHKMHAVQLPLEQVVSAFGCAPLPPPSPDMALGIGRTNDAILYGATVTLWMATEDEMIESLGSVLPSNSSSDFGSPFAEIFKRYDYDFYKVDPALFSPAQVIVFNTLSGNSWRFGNVKPDLIAESFGTRA